MKYRSFTQEFKRSTIEQLISGAAGPAEICRRYNLSSGQLYTWKIFSRKVIGYSLSRNIDTGLTLEALKMAIHNRNPNPGCIHHSDRGVRYASQDYVKEL